MTRSRALAAALAAGLPLVLAACGDGDDTATSRTTQAATASTAPATDTPATASPTTTVPGKLVEVHLVGGRVEGGLQRIKLSQGEEVTLVVTSDKADHVHLHGYDKEAAVGPNQPATITFTADLPGVWEAEAHLAKVTLVEFEVR